MVICFHYIPVQTSLAWTCVCSLALVNWGKWHGVAPLQGFIQSIFPSHRLKQHLLQARSDPAGRGEQASCWKDFEVRLPRPRPGSRLLAKMHRGMLSQGKDGEVIFANWLPCHNTHYGSQVGNASTLRSIHYPPIPDSLAARSFRYHCIKGDK